MIVHESQRWVYLGIPKTASTSIHRFFETRGARAVGDGQHSMHVPQAWREWLVFASTLNPFRRAWSLWRMLASDHRKGANWTHGLEPAVIEAFPTFVDELLLGPARPGLGVFQQTMSAWIDRVPTGVRLHLLPAEALEPSLRELGLLAPGEHVPRLNRRRGELRTAYDAEVEEKVRRWAEADFRRMGYSPRLRDWRRAPARLGGSGPWGLLGRRWVRVVETTGAERPSVPGSAAPSSPP